MRPKLNYLYYSNSQTLAILKIGFNTIPGVMAVAIRRFKN